MARRVATSNPHWNPAQGSAILTDPEQILDILGKAARQFSQVSIKIRGSDEQFASRLVDSKIAKTGIQVEFGSSLSSEAFKKELNRTKSRDCLLLIFASNRYILGVNVECDGIGYNISFKLPEKVFRLQRRKAVRYIIPAGYDMLVEMPSLEHQGLRIQRKLLDLSEYGLAFLVVSRDEGAMFRKSSIIKNCKLRIRNHEVTMNLVVMNRIEHDRGKRGGGTKIGTEFSLITDEDLDLVTHFVYAQLAQSLT
jgi:c-di-GMP-binding flagellar brake protein YcgR